MKKLLVLAAFIFPLLNSKAEKIEQPNIILIMTDDQGYGDVGSYGANGFTTPNIDKLATQGMHFTNYYTASAVCTPSRAALLTGCYPKRISMTQVLFPGSGPDYIVGKNKTGLNTQEETIAQALKKVGYATACTGKWHLGYQKEFLPLNYGFDEFLGIPYSHDMYPGNNPMFPPLPLISGNEMLVQGPAINSLTERFTDFSIDFIQRSANKPFFLYLAYSMPHVPLAVSEKFKGKTKNGLYGDVIYELDYSIGRIMQTLEEKKLDKNTIIIFTSDNGPWIRFGNHGGATGNLREGKGTSFDGGQKVPFIVKWPAKVPAGRECQTPVSETDLLPTLTAIAGTKPAGKKIDGHDISYLWKDKKPAVKNEPIYFYTGKKLDAVRVGKYKYHFVHNYDSLVQAGMNGKQGQVKQVQLSESLFDLDRDPSEKNNIIFSNRQLADQMKKNALAFDKELTEHQRPSGSIDTTSYPPVADSKDRKLLFQDEFDSDGLDDAKWNIMHVKRRKDPNGKDAWWHKDNCYVENGNLVIRTSIIDGAYCGGAVNTRNKFEGKYGYYESRVKMQSQEGHWGAFWLFTDKVNSVGNEGKDGTEIDIFESTWVGKGLDKVHSAFHYDGYGAAHKKMSNAVTQKNMNDGKWHVFGMEWSPKSYKFFYDGEMVWETSFGGVSEVPEWIIFSDEIGDWGGLVDIRKAILPDYMLVDYVRVFDKK